MQRGKVRESSRRNSRVTSVLKVKYGLARLMYEKKDFWGLRAVETRHRDDKSARDERPQT